MYIFQNKDLQKKLKTIIAKKKNIRLVKKDVKEINSEESFIKVEKKKFFYDLIILSIGSTSVFYSKIDKGRSIKKNYKEVALTTIIEHNSKIRKCESRIFKRRTTCYLSF